jgi:hypothetical protein
MIIPRLAALANRLPRPARNLVRSAWRLWEQAKPRRRWGDKLRLARHYGGARLLAHPIATTAYVRFYSGAGMGVGLVSQTR